MIFQAHKGVSSEAPENSFPAFHTAVKQGYGIIELDLGVTADGEFVVLHDNTVNRTARHKDGSALTEPVYINKISLKEAYEYDFGSWFSPKYKQSIACFRHVLHFARENGIKLKLDNKLWAFTEEQREALFALIKPYEGLVCLTCATVEAATEAAKRFPTMQIHYDGEVNEQALNALGEAIEKARLAVWLPLKNKNTAWARVPFASESLAALVKRYASLGVWLLSTYDELKQAEALGADIVETNGEIKPPARHGLIADMHTHSENSHDSECLVEDMLSAQTEKKTGVFAITDHCDIYSYLDYDIYTPLIRDYEKAAELNRKQSAVKLLSGMELSEGFWLPDQQEKAQSLIPYDVVVGSVHCVRYEGYTQAYSCIDFSAMPKEKIYEYLHVYFDDVCTLLDTADIDILAHLTCPLRYITGKYGIQIDMSVFDDKITAILKKIIRMGVALEVNTSSYDVLGDFFPSTDIIARYKSLGGYLVTLGSDAHVSERASQHFDVAIATLKSLGFMHIYYCNGRYFYQCSLM